MSAKAFLHYQHSCLTNCLNKLEQYYQFTNGWHYGEGQAYPLENILKVKELLLQTIESGFVKFEIFPGLDGCIHLNIYVEEWTIEVISYEGRLDSIYVEDPMGSTHYIESLVDYKKALDDCTKIIATVENVRNNYEVI